LGVLSAVEAGDEVDVDATGAGAAAVGSPALWLEDVRGAGPGLGLPKKPISVDCLLPRQSLLRREIRRRKEVGAGCDTRGSHTSTSPAPPNLRPALEQTRTDYSHLARILGWWCHGGGGSLGMSVMIFDMGSARRRDDAGSEDEGDEGRFLDREGAGRLEDDPTLLRWML
jgi:hypothetical protein